MTMRQKVSTILDGHLFRRAKLESVRQGKNISDVMGEALERYLAETGGRRPSAGVVADTWGILKLDRRTVTRLMQEEDGLFDA